MSTLQKIAEIEAEMNRTQKNKATNGHLGLLKAKLSKLKAQVITEAGRSSGGGGGEPAFEVARTGDARVGLIGFPSVGKSTLLNRLTNTFSEVAAYEFTTLTCVPGVFSHRGAKIQLLDLPGIIEGAKDGKGRGKQVISVGLSCDLILIVLDATKPLTHKRIIEKEVEGFGIRLNKTKPDIILSKREKGGVSITMAPGCYFDENSLDNDTAISILKEYRLVNCSLTVRTNNITADDLIDAIEGNRKYCPAIFVINKVDAVSIEELDCLSILPNSVFISAEKRWNLDGLVDRIWDLLDLTRVYTKPKGEIPDVDAPVILKQGKVSVEDFCNKIHRSLLSDFRLAVVWGRSVKFSPQKVGKEHFLEDEDVVQIVKRI